MSDSNWRKKLDILIDKNLSELIEETSQYNYAIKNAKNKSKAQMWIALALINSKLNKLLIEKKKYNSKIPKKEVEDIFKKLEKF